MAIPGEGAITLPAGPSAGLFVALGGAMFRRAARILGDETAAASAAEVLFVRFMVYADKSELDDRARWNWIYRVVTSHSLRQVPDQGRPGSPGVGRGMGAGAGALASAATLPDMRTLRRLDEATQSILVLRLLDGLTVEEIAQVLDLPVKLIGQRIAAAPAAENRSSAVPAGGPDARASNPGSAAGDIAGDGEVHPSSLALDRDRSTHAAHLVTCARCRAFVEEGDRLAARFSRDFAPTAVPRVGAAVRAERARRAAGPRWMRILWLGGGLAAVAVLALVVARPRAVPRADVPYAGLKGASRTKAAGIQISVGRGAEIRALDPDTVLRPGDRLLFRVKAERPRYLEVRVGRHAAERRVFPAGAVPEAAFVRPGQTLEVEYVVEDQGAGTGQPGKWQIVIMGLFADHPFRLDQKPGVGVEVVPVQADVQTSS